MSNWLDKSLKATLLAAAVGAGTAAYAQEQDNAPAATAPAAVECVPQKQKAKPGVVEKIAGDTAGQVAKDATTQAGREAQKATKDALSDALGGLGGKVFGRAANGAVRDVTREAGKAVAATAQETARDAARTVQGDKAAVTCEPSAEQPNNNRARQADKPSAAEKAANTTVNDATKAATREIGKALKGLKLGF
ncbi:MAG: hypothetical protein HYS17_06870 [Micavibrio aeruginosavorus]|uniref:Uncharacterized protein n=1 Tax=Micavibrio aeruginosavorus TaxID=349221 RepID=A0A7T5R0J6_9BACT|nr:MAG: hypothetical protein HYS17_06870 [Micavibrio aeruginosavorus]